MLNNILSQQFWLMEANYLKRFLENIQSKSYSDVLEIEARARDLNRENSMPKPYRVQDGIAVIDIKGVLMKRVPWVLTFLFGIQSMESIGKAFNSSLNDPDVSGIFLDVDSPGSEVDGVQTLSNIIFDGRGTKPILSFINGSGTSGAFWIGSSADQVILADQTTRTGSIGIIGTHMEYSEQAKQKGIGIHVFSSGKFKKSGNMFEKLSESDIKYIDGQFKYLHNLFIDGVEKNLGRKLSSDARESKIYLGQQAVDVNLADAIMTKGQAMAKLKSMINSKYTSFSKSKTSANALTKGNQMSFKDIGLKEILTKIQETNELNALSELEESLLSECDRRLTIADNWHSKQEAENLQSSITKLVGERRRQILAQPDIEKRQAEYAAGEAIARAIMPDRCKK